MKIGGYFITGSVIIIFTIVAIIFLQKRPDVGTGASRPEMLATRSLAKLPMLTPVGAGDASSAWDAIAAFYDKHSNAITPGRGTPVELEEQAIDLLIRAQELGTVSTSYLDSTTPMRPNNSPPFANAIANITGVAQDRAHRLYEKGAGEADRARADKIMLAVFAMGKNLFEKSQRVPCRAQGLYLMDSSLDGLLTFNKRLNRQPPSGTDEWYAAITDIDLKYWQEKWKVTNSPRYNKPPDYAITIGDLLKYATDDKDIAWRTEATLQLGRVKFMPSRGEGNHKAILATIEKLKSDKDPIIAAAAKAAEDYTKLDARGGN